MTMGDTLRHQSKLVATVVWWLAYEPSNVKIQVNHITQNL